MLQRIDIKADYACNNNCLFCVVSEEERANKRIPTGLIKDDLVAARKKGAVEVAFTGGEPTINRKIFELVQYAKECCYTTILIITNGRMLSNRKFAKKIVEAGANKFMFSIHGLENTHDRLTRVKGSFKQAMQGMKNILSLKQEVITDTVATKLNYKKLPKIVGYLLGSGSSVCQIDFVVPCGNAWAYRKMVVPKLSECIPYIHKTIDEAKKEKVDHKLVVMGVPYCFMEGYEKYMNEAKIPKIEIKSSIKKHSSKDYNQDRVEGKIKLEICSKCEFTDKCEGVWKNYVFLYGDDEVKVRFSAED